MEAATISRWPAQPLAAAPGQTHALGNTAADDCFPCRTVARPTSASATCGSAGRGRRRVAVKALTRSRTAGVIPMATLRTAPEPQDRTHVDGEHGRAPGCHRPHRDATRDNPGGAMRLAARRWIKP